MRITGKKKINRKCTENLCNNKNKNIGNQHADGKARYQTVHTEVRSFFPTTSNEHWNSSSYPGSFLCTSTTYYLLSFGCVYERERERERDALVSFEGVSVSVNYCTVAIVCFGPQNMKCKRLTFERSTDFFFPLPFWWISQNYTENHFSPFVIKDHCLLLWTAWTFCYRNYLGDTTNF